MRLISVNKFFGVAAASLLFIGCAKEDVSENRSYFAKPQTSVKEKVETLVDRLPEVAFYDEKTNRLIRLNPETREFSFATPNAGWNFSTNSGVTYVEDQGIVIIPVASFGSNTGGTVVAGSSTLDIGYTFCFSASDEALGLDLFDFGGDLDGVSAVIGIGGDFEALADGTYEDEDDFSTFFTGLATYIVYDNEASGSYEILNWLEEIDTDTDDLANKGFSYVVDFQNFNLYFSANGDLNVSGGEMSFSGEYLGFLELFDSLDEEDEDDFEYALVPGFGTMGCN